MTKPRPFYSRLCISIAAISFLCTTSVLASMLNDSLSCQSQAGYVFGDQGNTQVNDIVAYEDGIIAVGNNNNLPYLVKFDCDLNFLEEIEIKELEGLEISGVAVEDDFLYVTIDNSSSAHFNPNQEYLYISKFRISDLDNIWTSEVQSNDRNNVFNSLEIYNESLIVTGQNRDFIYGCDGLYISVDKENGSIEQSYSYNLGSCETFVAAEVINNSIYCVGRYNFKGGGQDGFRIAMTRIAMNGAAYWSHLYGANMSQRARLYNSAILNLGDKIASAGFGDYDGTSATDVELHFNLFDYDGIITKTLVYSLNNTSSARPNNIIRYKDKIYSIGNYEDATRNRNAFFTILNNDYEIDSVLTFTDEIRGSLLEAIVIGDELVLAGYKYSSGNSQCYILKVPLPLEEENIGCRYFTKMAYSERNAPLFQESIDLERVAYPINPVSKNLEFSELETENEAICPIINDIEVDLSYEICENDSIQLGGTVYNLPGVYMQELKSVDGCDSILNITISNIESVEVNINEELCEGETLIIDGVEYSELGQYIIQLKATNGCDSIINLNLDIAESFQTDLIEEICDGEFIIIDGIEYSELGQHEIQLIATNGCDSIIFLNLDVAESFQTDLIEEICDGEFIIIDGIEYSELGQHEIQLIATNGCDSIIFLNLDVLDSFQTDLIEEICDGELIIIDGIEYSELGQHEIQLIATNGCDSIINLEITESDFIINEIQEYLCQGDTLIIENKIVTESGEYIQLYPSLDGCDSLVQIEVILDSSYHQEIVEYICPDESVEINNQQYLNSGLYFQEYISQAGCDSIIEINIIENVVTENYLTTSICEKSIVELEGQRYTEPGDYQIVLTNDMGCDSLIYLNIVEGGIYIPNVFTPEDEPNQEFKPFISCSFTDYEFHIYDRWGNFLFFTYDYEESWDGYNNDKKVEQGVYTYMIKFSHTNDHQVIKSGAVTLLR